MTKIVTYRHAKGRFTADRIGASGSPIVGRGRSRAEAIGVLMLNTRKYERMEGTIEILEAEDQDGFWELARKHM